MLAVPAFAGTVISIADGNTLTVLVNKRSVEIRFANIDAPEKIQAYGSRSRHSLAEMCAGKEAKYKVQDIDR